MVSKTLGKLRQYTGHLRNPIVSTSFYFIVVTGLVKIFQFFLFSHLAKSLGVTMFGVFGLLYTYQVTLNTFSTVGIIEKLPSQFAGLKDAADRQRLYKKTNALFLLLSLLSIIAVLIYGFFDVVVVENFTSFIYIGISAIILSYFTIQSSFFRFDLKYLSSVIVSNLPLLISLVGLYVASLLGMAMGSIILCSLLGLLLGLVCLFFLKLTYGFAPIGRKDIAGELKVIWPFFFIAVFSLFSGYGANFLISKMLHIDDVGVFTFFVTVTSIMHLVANSMNLVWGPKFFVLFGEEDKTTLNRSNKRFYIFQTLILFFVSLAVVLFLAFFKGTFQEYKPHFFKLSFLFVAYLFNVPWYMNTNFYIASARSKKLMQIVSISGIIGLAGLYFFITIFGSYGIYFGFFLGYFAKSVLIGYDSFKTWRSDTPWVFIVGLSALLLLTSYLLSK